MRSLLISKTDVCVVVGCLRSLTHCAVYSQCLLSVVVESGMLNIAADLCVDVLELLIERSELVEMPREDFHVADSLGGGEER